MGLNEQFEQGLKTLFGYSSERSADAANQMWMVA